MSDTAFTRRTLAPARGNTNGQRKSIAIGFGADEFDRISKLSIKNGISFAEQVRRLCAKAMQRA